MNNILQNCYNLPWTEKDNPNGWIEPTTYCQLSCPGCYRGIDHPNHKARHQALSKMKDHIDWLITNRNIHTLSIAGGDPLVYPNLIELVEYASLKKLRTMIYTNGVDLNEEILIELKNAGATQVLIHIDVYQGRENCETEAQANAIRNQYCNLFRKVGGINLGFIQPLSRDSLKDLKESNRFFSMNRDIVNLVVYTLYREIGWKAEMYPHISADLRIDEVVEEQNNTGYYKPSAYLTGVGRINEPSWIFSYSVGTKDKVLGFFDKKVSRLVHQRYYRNKKKFLFISRSNSVHLSGLLKLFYLKSVAAILFNKESWTNKLFFQTILVIRGPVKHNGEWDLCMGCPDAIFDGKGLLPSCILNELQGID